MDLEDPAGTPALVQAIKNLHDADATLIEYVPVMERVQGKVVWSGSVGVFALTGHATATKVYAWSDETTGTRRKFYAVLHEGPVDSPRKAVRSAVLADAPE
jgi:hypothetical protein